MNANAKTKTAINVADDSANALVSVSLLAMIIHGAFNLWRKSGDKGVLLNEISTAFSSSTIFKFELGAIVLAVTAKAALSSYGIYRRVVGPRLNTGNN